MSRRQQPLQVTAGGVTRQATVDTDGTVTLDGGAGPVAVQRLDATTYRAVVDGRGIRVHLAATDSGRWAWAAGCAMTVEVDTDVGAPQRPRHRPPDLTAPMPATVVAVLVSPQQTVHRGEVLVTLEAMKMELSIRAPRDGVVETVRCAEGDLVQPGLPLVTLHADPGATAEE